MLNENNNENKKMTSHWPSLSNHLFILKMKAGEVITYIKPSTGATVQLMWKIEYHS